MAHQVFGDEHNTYVSGKWRDDGTLYLAWSDTGDSEQLGDGLLIRARLELLRWMISDRWGAFDGAERFIAYCRRNGFELRPTDGAPPPPERAFWGDDLPVSVHDGTVIVYAGDAGATPTPYRVVDPGPLLLQLIADRCEGTAAWSRIQRLIEASGVEAEQGWQGFA